MQVLKMGIVWVFSKYLTIMGIPHKKFQIELAETITRKYYLENAKTLASLNKEEYDMAESIIRQMNEVVLSAPTFYDSAKNVIAYAHSMSNEFQKIMKK